MQPVDASDEVERAVGTPGAQRRLDQPHAYGGGGRPVERPDQIDADDVNTQPLTLDDLSGLDQRLARAAAEVQPGDGVIDYGLPLEVHERVEAEFPVVTVR